jgi:benzoyl-CoA reductase/2-hydroxyglutaryl-CoA dehydratase subunit BcrC/BadD/HgdB
MKIFIYNNIIGNYCSGDYYFIASDRQAADTMANAYARNHNEKVNNNLNYTIEWDNEDVKEYDIKPGYIPLNRIVVDMEK